MLSLVGSLLLIAGAAGTGACICMEKERRISILEQFSRALFLAAGEVAYGYMDLPRVLQGAGQRLGGSLGEQLARIGRRLEDGCGKDLEEVWQEEMGQYLLGTDLKATERSLLLSFPKAIWFPDGARQQDAIVDFAKQCGRLSEQARQEKNSQARSVMALSLSAGILAAIILF